MGMQLEHSTAEEAGDEINQQSVKEYLKHSHQGFTKVSLGFR